VQVPEWSSEVAGSACAEPGLGAAGAVAAVCRLYSSSKRFVLARAEGDDPSDRVVRRDPYGYPVAGHDLDPEAAHSAAELSEHFVTSITLHTVETAAVHCHDRALHVDEIILTQSWLAVLSWNAILCHTAQGAVTIQVLPPQVPGRRSRPASPGSRNRHQTV